MVFVTRAGRQPTTPTIDLQLILHKRLRFLAFLFCGGMAVIVLLDLVQILTDGSFVSSDARLYLAVYVLMFTAAVVLAGILWRRQSLSLRSLRVLELLLFGVAFTFWTVIHACLYPNLVLSKPPFWFGFIMANCVSAPWVLLIIVYGILIPNTWRRSTAFVGIMAATPLVISVATGLSANATQGHSRGNYLIPMVAWMAAAAAVAIYGSHRIEILRQEVLAARRLGQYQLKQLLGAGGMGEVYLAEHVLLRRPCAVKLIRPERAGDPKYLRRFEREVQATAALTHPNTVQVFDYGHAEDGTFYFAMEYLPGLTLQELVDRHGPLPAQRAVYLLRQVCGALREAHAVGLIHRDIKPSNVIVCERGGLADVAKLLDYGLVHSLDVDAGMTMDREIAGTPAYMSPEQASGEADLDARCDIYALGSLAYFLLTGGPPFADGNAVRVLASQLCEIPEPPSRHRPVPADLETVILRCLAKCPTDRFPDVASLDAALTACGHTDGWTPSAAATWWRSHFSLKDDSTRMASGA